MDDPVGYDVEVPVWSWNDSRLGTQWDMLSDQREWEWWQRGVSFIYREGVR